MGLTVSRKTAQNLVVRRKMWKKLTVRRKKSKKVNRIIFIVMVCNTFVMV